MCSRHSCVCAWAVPAVVDRIETHSCLQGMPSDQRLRKDYKRWGGGAAHGGDGVVGAAPMPYGIATVPCSLEVLTPPFCFGQPLRIGGQPLQCSLRMPPIRGQPLEYRVVKVVNPSKRLRSTLETGSPPLHSRVIKPLKRHSRSQDCRGRFFREKVKLLNLLGSLRVVSLSSIQKLLLRELRVGGKSGRGMHPG